MAQPRKISGFPERLPEQRIVEEQIIEIIRAIYRSHGFIPIETAAVELLSTLERKGAIDKEIFILRRTHDEGEERSGDTLALHYDLTVPLARYVAQNFNELSFPFRRYQLQKVWRGERPQQGRSREFYQFDADIVVQNELPISCDAEMLTILEKVYRQIQIADYRISVNNRKLLQGFYEGLGLDESLRKQALGTVDKLAKIGPSAVQEELAKVGISQEQAAKILEIAQLQVPPEDISSVAAKFGLEHPLLSEGINELEQLFALVPQDSQKNMVVDLSLVRGLDYYTGSIFEVKLPQYPEYGSVGGGGRYENLCGEFLQRALPGVGISIGLTRLMDLAFKHNLLPMPKQGSAKLLVALYSEEQRVAGNALAEQLRGLGVPTEVFYKSPKLGKQIDYAAKKGIRYVAFIDPESCALAIKDINSGEQESVANITGWVLSLYRPYC